MSNAKLFTKEDLLDEIGEYKDQVESLEKENDEMRSAIKALGKEIKELEFSVENALSCVLSEYERLAQKVGVDS